MELKRQSATIKLIIARDEMEQELNQEHQKLIEQHVEEVDFKH
jgi:hypothetical protein